MVPWQLRSATSVLQVGNKQLLYSLISNTQASKKFKWRSLQGGGSSLWYNTKRSRMDKFKDSMRNILNFHKRSKYAEEETNQATSAKSKMVPKKKKGFSLPYWWVYTGWFGKYILTKLIEYIFS